MIELYAGRHIIPIRWECIYYGVTNFNEFTQLQHKSVCSN